MVGSGFGAAAPAMRLSEAGLRVTMVEKGPHIEPWRDFQQTSDPKYLLRYLKSYGGDLISFTCAEAYGGGSGFYEMVSLRAPSLAFEQTDAAGRRLWPRGVDRKALDPWYDLAEEMLHVQQIAPEEVPRTGLAFALMMKKLGYSCDLARYAVRGCVGSGFCVTGCVYGAKQSLHLNYLPRAVEAGARVETETEALWIRPVASRAAGGARGDEAKSGRRASSGKPVTAPRYEIVCRRGDDGGRVRYLARLVVLGGGTVGTAALLLRSRRHLPRLSAHVGRNVAFNGSVKTAGLLPEGFPEGDMFTGRSHPGVVSYHFLESHGVVVTAAKPLPLQAVAAARLRLDGDEREPAHWGEANVQLMRQFRRRVMVLVAFGLTPPAARITLDGERIRAELEPTPELRAYKKRTKELLHSILWGNDCRVIQAEMVDREGRPKSADFFGTAHQVGSCRMADGPEHGVVDASGELFGYPGLYVTDGAVIPSSLAVNTSLTILANAERIAAKLVERYAPQPAARGSFGGEGPSDGA